MRHWQSESQYFAWQPCTVELAGDEALDAVVEEDTAMCAAVLHSANVKRVF